MRGQVSAESTDPSGANGTHVSGTGDLPGATSFELPGGIEAPRHARSVTSAHLRHIDRSVASDAELIISELVTNSVRHAGVGSDQLVTVDLLLLSERLRITVTDPGCDREPRLVSRSADGFGGNGLRLVDLLSAEWGVGRDAVGATRVWCDLVLDPGPSRGQVH